MTLSDNKIYKLILKQMKINVFKNKIKIRENKNENFSKEKNLKK